MATSYVPVVPGVAHAHRVLVTRGLSHRQTFSTRDRAYFGHRHDYNYDIVRGRIKPNTRLVVACSKKGVPH